MKFARIICGTLDVPQNYPCQILLDDQIIVNPTEDQYRAAGYLPLEETEPEEIEGKVAIAHYRINDQGVIIQYWSYEDEPIEIED